MKPHGENENSSNNHFHPNAGVLRLFKTNLVSSLRISTGIVGLTSLAVIFASSVNSSSEKSSVNVSVVSANNISSTRYESSGDNPVFILSSAAVKQKVTIGVGTKGINILSFTTSASSSMAASVNRARL